MSFSSGRCKDTQDRIADVRANLGVQNSLSILSTMAGSWLFSASGLTLPSESASPWQVPDAPPHQADPNLNPLRIRSQGDASDWGFAVAPPAIKRRLPLMRTCPGFLVAFNRLIPRRLEDD